MNEEDGSKWRRIRISDEMFPVQLQVINKGYKLWGICFVQFLASVSFPAVAQWLHLEGSRKDNFVAVIRDGGHWNSEK